MHTTDWSADGDLSNPDITMHHNGDFSGDAYFLLPETALKGKRDGRIEVHIPFEAIKALVADYVYNERMRRLEDMGGDSDRILGL